MNGAAQPGPHPLRELASQLTIPAGICLFVVVCFAGIALVAPWLAPHEEGAILTDDSFVSPGEGLLLGGDYLGRALASRLIYGARVTLSLALAISALAFLLGSATGFLAAVRGGWTDAVLSRIVDALISFPAIMIALIVNLGARLHFRGADRDGGPHRCDAGISHRPRTGHGHRGARDYVEAARARGEKLGWIMWHEVLPNALAPLAAEFGVRWRRSRS